jgi:heme-degrading monooxygenase HmoA
MLTHVAVFRFIEGTTSEQVEALAAALRALPGKVPGIRGYEVGVDLRFSEETADFVVIARFDDEAGFRAYAEHPAHLEVSREFVRPILDQLTRVQFRS